MSRTVIGVELLNWTPPESTTPIPGAVIYLANEIPEGKGTGLRVERHFLSEVKLTRFGLDPGTLTGQTVLPTYNKYAKITWLELAD